MTRRFGEYRFFLAPDIGDQVRALGGYGGGDGEISDYDGSDETLPDETLPDETLPDETLPELVLPAEPVPTEDKPLTPEEKKQILREAKLALDILNKLLQATSKITDLAFREQLRQQIKDAKSQLEAGQQKMIDAGQRLSSAQGNLNTANDRINSLLSGLNDTKASLVSQLSTVKSISEGILSSERKIADANKAVADAQARLDQAKIRANYAPGSAGMKQMLADQKQASLDKLNAGISKLNLEKAKDGQVLKLFEATATAKATETQLDAERRAVTDAYAIAFASEAERNALAKEYNDGFADYRQGMEGYKDAMSDYQQKVNDFLLPQIEGVTATKGVANALGSIAEGNNFTAVADVANAGLESTLRNFADPAVQKFGFLYGVTLNEAGKAIDKTIKEGGSFLDGMRNFAVGSGNTLLGVDDYVKSAKSAENSLTYLGEGDVTGALGEFSRAVGPGVRGISKTAQTAGQIVPGLQPFSEGLGLVTPALEAGSTGVVGTLAKISSSKISTLASLEPLQPIEVGGYKFGRGIGNRVTPAGEPSAGTVALTGAGLTIGKMAQATADIANFMQKNPDRNNELLVKLDDIALTGKAVGAPKVDWGAKLRVGEVSLKPVGVPVGPVVGD